MEIVKENIDNLNAVIKIHLEPKDYEPQLNESLKKYKKQVKMPGFRPGMVPMGMVKKMVGNQILLDEVNKIISRQVMDYIEKEKLDILGYPMIKQDEVDKIDWNSAKDFTFSYEVGLAPSVDFTVSDKHKFTKYIVAIDDELVNKQIDVAAKRFGNLDDVQEANETDLLNGKFEELRQDGLVNEEGISHTTYLAIDKIKDEKLQKKFIGIKKGAILDFNPKELSDNETELAAMLGISKDKIGEVSSKVRFTVLKISRIKPHEVNQELFDKIFGKDHVKSLDEFKEHVKKDLVKALERDSDYKLRYDIEDYILNKLKLKLPDDFLKRWIRKSNEKPISAEEIEKEYDNYSKSLQWQLIENQIIKDNNLNVTAEEAIDYTKDLINQQMAQYGQPPMEEPALLETVNKVLSEEKERNNIYRELFNTKIDKLFKEKFSIKEKEISYDEFVKLVNSPNKSSFLDKINPFK